ncbi:MAG: hypothetical protein WBA54_04025, partial [Acidaminobacteraceae bacterium]
MKKIYIILLISILILSGCSKKNNISSNGLDKLDSPSQDTKLIADFYKLKDSGGSTSQLGDFLTTNITKLDEINTSILVTEIIKLGTLDKS